MRSSRLSAAAIAATFAVACPRAAHAGELLSVKGSALVQGLPVVEVDETITVQLDEAGFRELKERATSANPIGLYVDDTFLRDSPPVFMVSQPATMRFSLPYTDDNKGFWQRLMGRPWNHATVVGIAVGLADGSVVATSKTAQVSTKVYRPRVRWALVAAMLALVALLVRRARLGEMLRVQGRRKSTERPYSLGRSQMAWWFGHVVVAFLYVWAILGTTATITTQVLALLGIGAGTALGSTMIDASKAETTRLGLLEKVEATQTALAASPNDDKLVAARDAARTAADTFADNAPVTHGFLNDILTDAHDYSLHRLQMVVWTLILTSIFWYTVWIDVQMPEFSPTLLALMGLSSGTYLGFKFPEKS